MLAHDTAQASPEKPRRALLIINAKSGPARDSLMRVREVVDVLGAHGIAADVRVKLRKSQARREARAAVKAGYPLVVAAGGDGTVAAVARGLVGSKTVLGIIPLGTYNNVATSLGIPADLAQACALVAAAPVRAIDVGEVRARGMKRPRVFLEIGGVGIAAPVAAAGQSFEKGRWDAVARQLPQTVEMTPAVLEVRLDGRRAIHRAPSLLALVANTPRAGAGLLVAPEAKVDDGLLQVRVYEDMSQPALATHFLAVAGGIAGDDPRVHNSSARKVVIRSTRPLPVVVETKVVGSTPVRFRVRTGGLLVIVGSGDGLVHPAAASLASAITEHSEASASDRGGRQVLELDTSVATRHASGIPLVRRGGLMGVALAAGAAIALMPRLSKRLDRRQARAAPPKA
jgi:diacylglycerol kinase (ATP)